MQIINIQFALTWGKQAIDKSAQAPRGRGVLSTQPSNKLEPTTMACSKCDRIELSDSDEEGNRVTVVLCPLKRIDTGNAEVGGDMTKKRKFDELATAGEDVYRLYEIYKHLSVRDLLNHRLVDRAAKQEVDRRITLRSGGNPRFGFRQLCFLADKNHFSFRHYNNAWRSALSRDGSLLAVGTDAAYRYESFVCIYDLYTGQCNNTLWVNESTGSISDIKFSADGQLLLVLSYTGRFSLWHTRTGLRVCEYYELGIRGAADFLDQETIVAGHAYKVYVYNVQHQSLVRDSSKEYYGHPDPILTLQCSPCGKYILSISCNLLRLWNVARWQEELSVEFDMHKEGMLKSACFNSRGDRILLATEHTLKVLSVQALLSVQDFDARAYGRLTQYHRELAVFAVHSAAEVRIARYSPDDRSIIFTTNHGVTCLGFFSDEVDETTALGGLRRFSVHEFGNKWWEKRKRSKPGCKCKLVDAHFIPDGKIVAVFDDGVVSVKTLCNSK